MPTTDRDDVWTHMIWLKYMAQVPNGGPNDYVMTTTNIWWRE